MNNQLSSNAEHDYRNTPAGKRVAENPDKYQASVKAQEDLLKVGIAAHNHFADECTEDFGCCNPDIGEYVFRVPSLRQLQLLPHGIDEDKWIRIEDRLPELTEPLMGYNDENVRVVWMENNHAIVLAYNEEWGVYKAKLTKWGWSEISSLSSNGGINAIPTHWQPLPASPSTQNEPQ